MNLLRYDKATKCLYIRNPNRYINLNSNLLTNYTENYIENTNKDEYFVSFENLIIDEILISEDVIQVYEIKEGNNFAAFIKSSDNKPWFIERVNIIDDKGMKNWKIKITHKFYNIYRKILAFIDMVEKKIKNKKFSN
jgi:hypothetical protein